MASKIIQKVLDVQSANDSIKSPDIILQQLQETNKHLHKINKKIKISKHRQSRTNPIK